MRPVAPWLSLLAIPSALLLGGVAGRFTFPPGDPVAAAPMPPPVVRAADRSAAGTTHTVKERLSEIDWHALKPGDTVEIPWRKEPYRERIVIPCRGTKDAWVTVKGTPGPKGELPVIDGGNATTDPQFALSYAPIEEGGLVTVWRTKRSGAVRPQYVRLQGLRIQGANADRSDPGFTGADGKAKKWSPAASGVYLLGCDHVEVVGCQVTDCGTGIFSADSEGNVCSDLLLEGNGVWGNGKVGSERQHNTYVQAAGVVYRGNSYGPLREGSKGGALKDRSADVLIEGNTIEASARQIDLSSWQEDVASRQKLGNATRTVIRNNVLPNRTGARVVYVEGRTLPDGTGDRVEFANNTVVIRRDQSQTYSLKVFFSEYSKAAAFTAGGNLIDVDKATDAGKVPEVRLFDSKGTLTLGANWTRPGVSQYAIAPADRTVEGWDKLVAGKAPPGFTDERKGDYRLTPEAAAKGYGADAAPVTPPAPAVPPKPAPTKPDAAGWVEVKRTRIEDKETAVETILYRKK